MAYLDRSPFLALAAVDATAHHDSRQWVGVRRATMVTPLREGKQLPIRRLRQLWDAEACTSGVGLVRARRALVAAVEDYRGRGGAPRAGFCTRAACLARDVKLKRQEDLKVPVVVVHGDDDLAAASRGHGDGQVGSRCGDGRAVATVICRRGVVVPTTGEYVAHSLDPESGANRGFCNVYIFRGVGRTSCPALQKSSFEIQSSSFLIQTSSFSTQNPRC